MKCLVTFSGEQCPKFQISSVDVQNNLLSNCIVCLMSHCGCYISFFVKQWYSFAHVMSLIFELPFASIFIFSVIVWGYGFLAITIISLLSLSVISVIPCLKKSFYHKVMAYLVALAVGTLAGDALLHLIPHVSIAFLSR